MSGNTPCNKDWAIPDPTWSEAAAMIDCLIHQRTRYKCRNITPMGNWHICQDQPYNVKSSGLVYSLGIQFDSSFDDAMGKLRCHVHSFDPSMNTEDHQHSANVAFHNLGLAGFDMD